jgi:hypothetical protein
MAKEAARLLDGTGWLPEPLRLAGAEPAVAEPACEAEDLLDFLTGEEDAAADPSEAEPRAIAAEQNAPAGRLRPLRAKAGCNGCAFATRAADIPPGCLFGVGA